MMTTKANKLLMSEPIADPVAEEEEEKKKEEEELKATVIPV
jgi:hypothetical protein